MNKSDILIVCALPVELSAFDGYHIIYTGVGKVNAAFTLATNWEVYQPELVINYGTAGSKNEPIAALVDCTKFIQRDMDVRALGFKKGVTPFDDATPYDVDFSHVKNPLQKHFICGSGDSFVSDVKQEIEEIQIYDMEAYALAKVCMHKECDFISYKYITDNANEASANDWTTNCGKGAKEFKKMMQWYEN